MSASLWIHNNTIWLWYIYIYARTAWIANGFHWGVYACCATETQKHSSSRGIGNVHSTPTQTQANFLRSLKMILVSNRRVNPISSIRGLTTTDHRAKNHELHLKFVFWKSMSATRAAGLELNNIQARQGIPRTLVARCFELLLDMTFIGAQLHVHSRVACPLSKRVDVWLEAQKRVITFRLLP